MTKITTNQPIQKAQLKASQQQAQKINSNSIFDDVNENNIVDKEDFKGNEVAYELASKQNWLGQAWDYVGKQLNKLLKLGDVNNTENYQKSLDNITKNCKIDDGSSVALSLVALLNESALNENFDFNENVRKMFAGEIKQINTFRDGGSTEIILNDGTKIFFNLEMFSGNYASTQITDNNGNTKTYNDEGNLIENN